MNLNFKMYYPIKAVCFILRGMLEEISERCICGMSSLPSGVCSIIGQHRSAVSVDCLSPFLFSGPQQVRPHVLIVFQFQIQSNLYI